MKVVLTRNVKALGAAGEIVNVSDGYGRNYLLPKKLAVPAGPGADRIAGEMQKRQQAHEAGMQARAKEFAAKLRGVTCTLKAPADDGGKLYGSITEKDVVAALAAAGVQVDKRQIHLESHIKTVGEFSIPVQVAGEQFESVTLQVVADRPC